MPAGHATAPYGNANISITSADGRPPVIPDFYTNSSGTRGFFRRPVEPTPRRPPATFLRKSNSGTSASYAQTVAQVLNISNPTNSTYNATFETKGYAGLPG